MRDTGEPSHNRGAGGPGIAAKQPMNYGINKPFHKILTRNEPNKLNHLSLGWFSISFGENQPVLFLFPLLGILL